MRVIGTARKMPDIVSERDVSRYRDALEAAVQWIERLPIYQLPGALVARDVQSLALAANRMPKVLENLSIDGHLSDGNYESLCGLSDAAEKALEGASSFADNYRGGTDVIRATDL
ncbi:MULTISPECIES: hypothetical protein [Pseudomonas]|uniref:hypothetical protein n=1 Tax=Pseudomonas TaxID=286 RepID=UPI0012DFEC96|nr:MULTISPECIES: hypothetical protein [Pseudomonas]